MIGKSNSKSSKKIPEYIEIINAIERCKRFNPDDHMPGAVDKYDADIAFLRRRICPTLMDFLKAQGPQISDNPDGPGFIFRYLLRVQKTSAINEGAREENIHVPKSRLKGILSAWRINLEEARNLQMDPFELLRNPRGNRPRELFTGHI